MTWWLTSFHLGHWPKSGYPVESTPGVLPPSTELSTATTIARRSSPQRFEGVTGPCVDPQWPRASSGVFACTFSLQSGSAATFAPPSAWLSTPPYTSFPAKPRLEIGWVWRSTHPSSRGVVATATIGSISGVGFTVQGDGVGQPLPRNASGVERR